MRLRKKLFIKSFNSLGEAFSNAMKAQGQEAKVLIMPYGNSTLPVFEG